MKSKVKGKVFNDFKPFPFLLTNQNNPPSSKSFLQAGTNVSAVIQRIQNAHIKAISLNCT